MASPSPAKLSVRQGALLAALVAGLALVVSLYVAFEKAPLAGDVSLTREIQSWSWFSLPADAVNRIGDVARGLFLVPMLIVTLKRTRPHGLPAQDVGRQAIGMGLILAFALSFLNGALKNLVRSPRPMERFGVDVDRFRDSYGFPSGHVYTDVLLFGAIALVAPLWLPRRWVWLVRAFLALVLVLSGPARVFVGAHWPSDTVGGYLWGSAALLAAFALGEWMVLRAERRRAREE